MDRLLQRNVLAMSGRAVEAAGDVDVLLLDKTGTITLGNRQATEFLPAPASRNRNSPTPRNSRRSPTKRPKAAASSCWPKNSACAARTIARFARRAIRAVHRADAHERRGFVDGGSIRKGAANAMRSFVTAKAACCRRKSEPWKHFAFRRHAARGGRPANACWA
jgi:potassium-transporting ATPase ATP-binding subunit